MPTRLHKNRSKRGHVSAGHGRVGKHRKHPGGRGNAGPQHHHRINITKYHPGYIGKHGMRQFNRVHSRHFTSSINVEQIFSLLTKEEQAKIVNSNSMPVIDVTKAGYFKVLGKGVELDRAMVVRARQFSKLARERIEAAGGKCELIGEI